MEFTIWENALWVAGFTCNIALLAVLVVKKRIRDFPIFTSFIAYGTIETITLFLVSRHGSHKAYFHTFWTFALGDYLLQMGLIFEIARDVLRPTGSWIRDARRDFALWSGLGFLVAAVLAFAITPPGRTGIELWSVRSSMFTSLLTCEVFLAMMRTANRLGLPWQSHVIALGQGLTVWAVVALTSDVADLGTGWQRNTEIFDNLRSFAFVGTVLFWIVKFALPERKREPLSNEMRQYLIALHEQVLHDLEMLKSGDKP